MSRKRLRRAGFGIGGPIFVYRVHWGLAVPVEAILEPLKRFESITSYTDVEACFL